MNGRGKLTFPDGKIYEGEFKDGSENGKGMVTWPDGRIFEGTFVDGDVQVGSDAKMKYKDGEVLAGPFKNWESYNKPKKTMAEKISSGLSLFSSRKTEGDKSVMKALRLSKLNEEVEDLKKKLAAEMLSVNKDRDKIGKLQLKIDELTGQIDLLEDDLNVSQLQQLQEPPPPAASADKLYWQEQWENHRKNNDDPYEFLGGYKRQRRQSKRRSKRQRRQSKRRQSKRRQSHKK